MWPMGLLFSVDLSLTISWFLLQYTDTMLYTQLCFYEHIFDADKALKAMTDGSKEKRKYFW